MSSRSAAASYALTVPARLNDDELQRPSPEEEAAIAEATRQALEARINGKIAATRPQQLLAEKVSANVSAPAAFVRYTPTPLHGMDEAAPRVIRMVQQHNDPLEPPKFKHAKTPRGPPSPPAPVLHSPPRKVSVKDQQDWKVPPCISNWKNPNGFTIPLDKRLAADGRDLQETVISDRFAKLSESLYLAEATAREELEKRQQLQQKLLMKEQEKKEELLRRLAQEARLNAAAAAVPAAPAAARVSSSSSSSSSSSWSERADRPDRERERERDQDRDADDDGAGGGDPNRNLSAAELEELRKREDIRESRRRERERERRQEELGRKRNKYLRDDDRDISERIALGQKAPSSAPTQVQYDQRLFNQSGGLDSGFGAEDDYNVYDKPLFAEKASEYVYRKSRAGGGDDPFAGDDDQPTSASTSGASGRDRRGRSDPSAEPDTSRFRPDRDFANVDRDGPRVSARGPIQFDRDGGPDVSDLLASTSRDAAGGRLLDGIGKRGGLATGSAGTREDIELSARSGRGGAGSSGSVGFSSARTNAGAAGGAAPPNAPRAGLRPGAAPQQPFSALPPAPGPSSLPGGGGNQSWGWEPPKQDSDNRRGGGGGGRGDRRH